MRSFPSVPFVLVLLQLALVTAFETPSTCGAVRDAFLSGACCTASDDSAVSVEVIAVSGPPAPPLSPPTPEAPPAVIASCANVVVGGGTGGLYTAYRMIFDAGISASEVCICEADSEMFGRIKSLRGLGDQKALVVDGALSSFSAPPYYPLVVPTHLHVSL